MVSIGSHDRHSEEHVYYCYTVPLPSSTGENISCTLGVPDFIHTRTHNEGFFKMLESLIDVRILRLSSTAPIFILFILCQADFSHDKTS